MAEPMAGCLVCTHAAAIIRKVEMKINVVMVVSKSCEQYIEDYRREELMYHKQLLHADVLDAKHRYESMKAQLEKVNAELGATDGDDEQTPEPKKKKPKNGAKETTSLSSLLPP